MTSRLGELAEINALDFRVIGLIGGKQLVPRHGPARVRSHSPKLGAEGGLNSLCSLVVIFSGDNTLDECLVLLGIGELQSVKEVAPGFLRCSRLGYGIYVGVSRLRRTGAGAALPFPGFVAIDPHDAGIVGFGNSLSTEKSLGNVPYCVTARELIYAHVNVIWVAEDHTEMIPSIAPIGVDKIAPSRSD